MMRAIRRLTSLALIAAAAMAGNSARQEGIAAFKEGRYSIALVKFREVLGRSSDRTTRVFAALTQAALGDCEAALPELTARPEPNDPVLYRMATLTAVKCYSTKHDEAKTFSLLQRLRERFPDDPDVLYMSVKLHMKAFNDATFERSAAALDNPDHVAVVIHNYRWRLGLAEGEPQYDELEQQLAAGPTITVPTITLEGDANGAPHPEASAYASKFAGRYAHRVIEGGVGHNLPQEAPQAFAQAIVDVDAY